MTDIEKEILDIIEEVTECKYVGKFKVRFDGEFWILALYFNQFDTPRISLALQTDDYEEFKDYVRKEMKQRKLETVRSWTLKKLAVPEDNTKC